MMEVICLQLCFDNPLSNCTYDLFTNDQCDAECNNQYCEIYSWSSGLEVKVEWFHEGKGRVQRIKRIVGVCIQIII